jgi:FtsZ-binding cell division protein ZapB
MRLEAIIKNGLDRNAILGIEIEEDRGYRDFLLIPFFSILIAVFFTVCFFLYTEWFYLIGAIVSLLLAIIGLFKHKKYAVKKLKQNEYFSFKRYFLVLIFPFIILIMAGVFFTAWLILNDKFSMLEIGILVVVAESACFCPCYMYETHVVEKAIIKHKSPTLYALIKLLQHTISFLKEEKELSTERRKSIIEILESLLLKLQEIIKKQPSKH